MRKVSPEYRDQLEMEIWYKAIGDHYALWLIEQNKQQHERMYEAFGALPDVELLKNKLNDLSDWLHNISEIEGEDFKTIDKYLDWSLDEIEKINNKLDIVHGELSE